MKLATAFVLAITASTFPGDATPHGTVGQGDEPRREKIPDAAAVKEAEKTVRALFPAEYKQRDPARRLEFARKLLERGAETKSDLAARYFMLHEAFTLAGETPAGVETALAALDRLSESFAGLDRVDLAARMLGRLKGAVRSPEEAGALGYHHMTLAEAAAREHKFEPALRLLKDAESLARAAKDAHLTQRVSGASKETREMSEAHKKVASAEARLAADKNDPEASAAYGWFLGLYKGDWDRALPMLVKGVPGPGQKEYAELVEMARTEAEGRESKDPKKLHAAMARFHGWAVRSKVTLEKRNALGHALEIGRVAWAYADGLAKSQIENLTRQIYETEIAGVSRTLELFASVDPTRDAVSGTWKMENGRLAALGPACRLQLPYQPGEEYDFRVQFSRPGNAEVGLSLSKNGKGFAFLMGSDGNTVFGFHLVDGMHAKDNVSAVRQAKCLEEGVIYTALVQVRNDGLKAYLNDKLICSFKTDYKNLTAAYNIKLRSEAALGLISSNDATFLSAQVVEVKGAGKQGR
jgi:hypothetical protein